MRDSTLFTLSEKAENLATMAVDNSNQQNGESHSDRDVENGTNGKQVAGPRRRSAVRALIQDFSPVWVTWSMNLGILATLTHTLPYQFNGLRTISAVLFVADLLVFIICSVLMILRFVIHGKSAWQEITGDVNELCFMACYPISWMTLTTLTALIVSTSFWGGYAFTIVSYVMWWIAVFWTLLFAVGIYVLLTVKQLTDAPNVTLALILPAVATATTAAEGGLVSIYAKDITARLAVPVIISSFMLVGVGFFLAIMIYSVFLQRILVNSWFDGVKRPQLMMLLGPAGQSTTALLALSTAANMHFPEYSKGTFLQGPTVEALHGACVMFGLMMFGLGVFWTFWAVYGIMDAVFRRQSKWTPAWYATVFPTGTMNSAMILFSEQFDSPAFRVIATGLLIILSIITIGNAFYTVMRTVQGKILIVREDPRLKKDG